MKKRILVLSASPRRGGNSDTLCDQFIRGAQEAGHSAEKVFLRDMRIGYCTGCGLCNERPGTCSQQDDMPELARRMMEADVIVMATPVYFYTMDAQMKTLIDRCCPWYTRMGQKDYYYIVTAADRDVSALERTVDGLRGFTLCVPGAREKGVIYGAGAWKAGEITATPAMREAYEVGKRV